MVYPFSSPEKIGTVLFGGNEIVTYLAYMFILEIKQGDTLSVEEFTCDKKLEKRLLQLKADFMKANLSYFQDYEKLGRLQYKSNFPYCGDNKGFNQRSKLRSLERELERKKICNLLL